MKETKQVIVIRRDLKMRRGKEIAQGSHSSLSFLIKQISDLKRGKHEVYISEEAANWLQTGTKKVCVRVNSEAELLDICEKSRKMGLEVNMVTDAGHTEFGGKPTITCLAIGPNWSDLIDRITGALELY
jgi:peptidyl-tRNA hydrolase, PTH2 family